MQCIRGHKSFITPAICAILFTGLALSLVYPCHEYVGSSSDSLTLGYDICNDSPYLPFKPKNPDFSPLIFSHCANSKATVTLIYVNFIFHPPRAESPSLFFLRLNS
jgi:hypothetical protein